MVSRGRARDRTDLAEPAQYGAQSTKGKKQMIDEQPTAESIPHSVIVRAPGLLPMLYKVRELAQELDTSSRRIRRWARRGLPHERDGRNHIWINGEEFARWVEDQRHAQRGPKLKPHEGYCLRCRRAVRIVDPVRQSDGKKTLLHGACPRCGATVNRGVACGQPRQLPQG